MTPASSLKTSRTAGRPLIAENVSMLRGIDHVPRLLVSVRSVEEARRALAGGVEILDVKEPSRGSLGMADVETIAQIAKLATTGSRHTPASAALGEVADWKQTSVFPTIPSGIKFAKLGLSRCVDDAEWRTNWQRIRAGFEQHSLSKINWVAVAYADSVEAASPAVEDIMDAAIETRCAGLLIDTWTKNGLTLLDRIDTTHLTAVAKTCHRNGLFFALAGRVRLDSLTTLATVPADVIAIRSAACRGSDRTSELDSTSVTAFAAEMRCRFATHENGSAST